MIGIIPAAGAGLRIQPLGCSKELLPVGSREIGGVERPKAVSEYLVERMIAAGAARGPGGLLMMGTRLEVVAVELIEPGAPQAQLFSGSYGLDAFVAEEAQHMTDKRRSTALGQLGSFSFSSGERSKTGGRCPPDPLGFIALGLLQQGGDKAGGLLPARLIRTSPFASLQIGAQVASLRCPILRWSTSRLSAFNLRTREPSKSPLLIARPALLT